MERQKMVTVRLDAEEIAALRKLPGDNDAMRLRSLIHAGGATDRLTQTIAATVIEKLAGGEAETQRLIKALGSLLNQAYVKLSDQINRRSQP